MTGLNISSVTSSGNNVSVNFPTPQYANIQSIGGTAMLPQHIWSSVGNPALYTAATPVGTGPYMLTPSPPKVSR